MSEPRWAEVSEVEIATAISPASFCAPGARDDLSPIDDYYAYVEELLKLGLPKAFDENSTLGKLLLLGLVSGVENYVRAILAGLIRVCPICRATASDHQIPFGAIDFYGDEGVELSLFDATSLAGDDEIRKKTQKLLALPVPSQGSLDGALKEFGKVCELRHAAIHARGRLGRGNARALGLGPQNENSVLTLTYSGIQTAGAICHSMVRSYNRFLFRETIQRWIAHSRFTGDWGSDGATFSELFNMFHSKTDAVGPGNAYQCYRALIPTISVASP